MASLHIIPALQQAGGRTAIKKNNLLFALTKNAMRYVDYSWPVAVSGFIFCMTMLLTGFNIPMRRLAAARA